VPALPPPPPIAMTGLTKMKAAAATAQQQRGRSPTAGHGDAPAIEMKFVLLGSAGVGKTSLASRLVYDRFRASEAPTIGAAFSTKMFSIDAPRAEGRSKRITLSASPTKPTMVKAVLWDTAGQEKYHSLTPMYYRNAMCALICYDVTSRESFEAAQKWSDELRLMGPEHIIIAVVGNKCDAPNAEREVPTSEAKAWSHAIGAVLWEVSAKEGKNVQRVFEDSALRVLRHPLALNARPHRQYTPPKIVAKSRWPCFGR
jgi:small GTP-binding protein